MNIDFNERARIVHENNHKWWINIETGEPLDRNKGEMLMLVITELAEAAEGIRKNLMDDHLPNRPMAEVELADAEIRMLDFAGGFDYEIDSEVINTIYTYDVETLIENLPSNGEIKLPLNKLEQLLDVGHPIIILNQLVKGKEFLGFREIDIPTVVTGIIFSIRAFAYIFGYDIEGAFHEKNEYNKTRKDHSIEERLKPNGKKV
jgi:hypothetical protein